MEHINRTFAGVEPGGGICLIQAEYSDGCESAEVPRGLAEEDERHDWMKLTDEALNCCCAALPFTDAEGCRFLVSALMRCDLRGAERHIRNVP